MLKFRPDARIVAHHGNVKDSSFDVDFVRTFDVVLNGLDNLEARKHVNRLCLAAEVPLIESGTTGYLGQVTAHVRGQTACFECTAGSYCEHDLTRTTLHRGKANWASKLEARRRAAAPTTPLPLAEARPSCCG